MGKRIRNQIDFNFLDFKPYVISFLFESFVLGFSFGDLPIWRNLEYFIIFIYFQAAASALFAVSVLNVEKNIMQYFENSTQINMPAT